MESGLSLNSIDWYYLQRRQFEVAAKILNGLKAAEYHHLRVAALSQTNERRFYEVELTVSCLIQSDCFK